MGKTTRKTKAVRLTEQDDAIIATLQQHYGMASANEVIGMALRSALPELPTIPTTERNAFPSTPWNGVGFQAILEMTIIKERKMDIGFFVRGLIIGFSVAAVVGPMGVLCIQRTLDKGQLYGLVSGLGIATADAAYSCIAGFGLTVIAAFLVSQQRWIHLIGGLFLIYLGIRTFLTRPAARAAVAKANTFFGAYVSTFLLTLTNPLTILSFAAIFAGIGVGGASQSDISATLVVSGVFVGSTLWWCLLTGSVSILRTKFHHRALRWVNRIVGVSITVFGVLALLSLRA